MIMLEIYKIEKQSNAKFAAPVDIKWTKKDAKIQID